MATEMEAVMEEPKKRKKADFLKLTMYTTMFGIMGGVSFYGLSQLNSNLQENTSSVKSTNGNMKANNFSIAETVTGSVIEGTDVSDGVVHVADAVLPSIVQITVKGTQTVSDIFGGNYEQESTGKGSGVIVGQDDSKVYIATNNHVVIGSSEVTIQFNDGKSANATVKGTDSISDLAVVEVKLSDLSQDTITKIKVAQIGSSDAAKVGQQVIAVGNALGYGTSVTVGYLSAKDREVAFEDGTQILMQTDAAINPGNSGGALVDSTGKLIGVNCGGVVAEEVEGMNYAIPIDTAMPIIKRLMTQTPKADNEKAYLGIQGNEVTSQVSEYYQMPQGIYINEVTKGSPAESAGLKTGDIICAIDGQKITNTTQLQEQLSFKSPNDKVKLTVARQQGNSYEETNITATLGSKATNN